MSRKYVLDTNIYLDAIRDLTGEKALDRFLERLDSFLHMAVTELQAVPATFKEFHAKFVAPPVKPAEAVRV